MLPWRTSTSLSSPTVPPARRRSCNGSTSGRPTRWPAARRMSVPDRVSDLAGLEIDDADAVVSHGVEDVAPHAYALGAESPPVVSRLAGADRQHPRGVEGLARPCAGDPARRDSVAAPRA